MSSVGDGFYVAHRIELSELYAQRIDHGRHTGGTKHKVAAMVLAIVLPTAWVVGLRQKQLVFRWCRVDPI